MRSRRGKARGGGGCTRGGVGHAAMELDRASSMVAAALDEGAREGEGAAQDEQATGAPALPYKPLMDAPRAPSGARPREQACRVVAPSPHRRCSALQARIGCEGGRKWKGESKKKGAKRTFHHPYLSLAAGN